MPLKMDFSSKPGASSMFKQPQLYKNLGSCGNICNSRIDGFNFSKNSASRTGNSLKYQLSYGLKLDSATNETLRGDSRARFSGTHYLKHLPAVLSRRRNVILNEEDLSTRHSFPEAASVSLPTSTTTLEYLLYRRSSRAETPEDGGKEASKYESSYRSRSKSMIRALSASDASSFTPGATPDYIVNQFFYVEPCLYTNQVITRVARILDFLQTDNTAKLCRNNSVQTLVDNVDIFMMDNVDTQEQVITMELTFTILKFQKLFEDALKHANFFVDYSKFKEYSSLVKVLLYDLHNRRFQKRPVPPSEQARSLCREIEDALFSRKTRLQSFIAKERVKHNAPSIDFLLPESLRKVNEAKLRIPIYLWVNQLKTTLEEIVTELETEGFTKLEYGEDIAHEITKVFQVDKHCSDLLIFPAALGEHLRDTAWVQMGRLVQQDKSSCLAAESVQYLLSADKDVIHVNVGTGITTAHLASLLKKRSPHSHIWGFGIGCLSKIKRIMQNVEFIGAGKNTKFLIDDFLSVDPEEPRLKSVRVILITANCSMSAVTNPIQFVISEGEDMHCLGNLFNTSQGVDNMADLVLEHGRILKHALSFSRVNAVVYATRSCYKAENESIVTSALLDMQAISSSRRIPFRVTPPVLPFTFEEIDSGTSGISDRYVKFLPSDKSNGCFVAIISREPDSFRDAARSFIPILRSIESLEKTQSLPATSEARNDRTADTHEKTLRQAKGKKRKLKDAVSAPELKVGIRSKLAGHKSAAAFGARLYQVDLVQKMEQRAKQRSRKPEHTKTIKSAISLSGLSESEIPSTE